MKVIGGEFVVTRNVGITLTDLAYQVWVGIPHGLRSNLISEFLTKNAEALTNLESPYDKFLHINKRKTEDPSYVIRKLIGKGY